MNLDFGFETDVNWKHPESHLSPHFSRRSRSGLRDWSPPADRGGSSASQMAKGWPLAGFQAGNFPGEGGEGAEKGNMPWWRKLSL